MKHTPHFSIVIPTYARPHQLVTCLTAVSNLEYARNEFEVIVVDDGSEVPLDSFVAHFRDHLDLTLLRQPNAGPATARNTGAVRARGKYLAFTDDDCAPAADWLQALAARFATTPNDMIGGRSVNALPQDPYSATSQMLTDAVYAYYNDDPRRDHFFATNNLALPTACFRTMGGFDSSFPLSASEDREFCDRWLFGGLKMTYAPEAVVYHHHAMSFRSFWKQHFRYGRGASHFHRVRVARGRGEIKVDPRFYLHMFCYPFLNMRIGRALLLEALMILSYAAYTTGFFLQNLESTPTRSSRKADGVSVPSERRYSG